MTGGAPGQKTLSGSHLAEAVQQRQPVYDRKGSTITISFQLSSSHSGV